MYKKFLGKMITSLFMGLFMGLGFFITYAANLTSISSTYNTGDTLGIEWFNDLKTRVINASPTGAIVPFYLSSCPTGWILANGSNGTPDLRGEFIRGLDSGRGVDSGRTLGSWQSDSFKIHHHSEATNNGIAQNPGRESGNQTGQGIDYGDAFGEVPTSDVGTTETRPRNIALIYCMKQ